ISGESEHQDDMDFDRFGPVDLSWIADAVTGVAPLNISPRKNTHLLAPVPEGPPGESIFATAEDLQESMLRVAAALGRPRTAGLYLEDIEEEDVDTPEQLPVSRAACKKRAEAEVTKTKYYFEALRNSESQLSP
ncbi:hypothetical protein FRC01_011253, partial [Tulasnella sp. 417]